MVPIVQVGDDRVTGVHYDQKRDRVTPFVEVGGNVIKIQPPTKRENVVSVFHSN